MEYRVIRSGRKTLGLTIGSDGVPIVRAPYLCTEARIRAFVKAESAWIEKQRAKLIKAERAAEEAGTLSAEEISRLADEMKRVLPGKLKLYAPLIGVEYGRVTVRRQKSKWGSCSAQGNLNFNCLLMLAPEEVLDYVVVHELCHRKHMDHSKEFWAEVRRVMPDHEKQKKWLKENGAVLMRRIREE